jgi:hypothetical protein
MHIRLFLGEKTAPGVFSFDYSKDFIRSCGMNEFREKLKSINLSFIDSPEAFEKVVFSAVQEALSSEYKASKVYKAGKFPANGKVCYICVNVEDANKTLS